MVAMAVIRIGRIRVRPPSMIASRVEWPWARSRSTRSPAIDDLGGPKSHGAYPAAWAYATATPFTYGKGVTSGGGCSTAQAAPP